ncbi:hypothetical protein BpHYR1_002240 [Brachionus plicatilis]|uniref:Uncharacterized protein n=1 Tax=Brachionus plicatilis TaxID=10195 RepID=A0A3M7SEH2_BRAPC|nr:hypothetical protein BpHYR1_002240 [Brachionus plicatilis]
MNFALGRVCLKSAAFFSSYENKNSKSILTNKARKLLAGKEETRSNGISTANLNILQYDNKQISDSLTILIEI